MSDVKHIVKQTDLRIYNIYQPIYDWVNRSDTTGSKLFV